MTPIELHKHIQQRSLPERNLIPLEVLSAELGMNTHTLKPVVDVLHNINFVELEGEDTLRITETGLYSNLEEVVEEERV